MYLLTFLITFVIIIVQNEARNAYFVLQEQLTAQALSFPSIETDWWKKLSGSDSFCTYR